MAKRRAEMMSEFEAKVGPMKSQEQTVDENENHDPCFAFRPLSSGTARGMRRTMRRGRTTKRMKN